MMTILTNKTRNNSLNNFDTIYIMLTNLIENRGKEFSNLIKIGDYLARTLRENVEMFGVDDGVATYLTESGHVISGKYSFKPSLRLSKIQVEDASVLENRKIFESSVTTKISDLLSDLLESDYTQAEGSFDKILSLYETKISYERIKDRLQEKVSRFGEQTSITSTDEFSRLSELRNQLVEFLKENKDIAYTPTIQNGMKLTTLVATSFDLPRMEICQLKESKKFEVSVKGKIDLYEYLCRKELVQKEILEAKQSFENIWIDNPQVQELASMVFERDEATVRHQVAQTISDVPYFALATKKQIAGILKNSLTLHETSIKSRDINNFAGGIYRMKKPVKAFVLDTLNEKYGIDIKSLTEVPTFRSLALTESKILKDLARAAPKNTVLSKTLHEFASILPSKDGTETIDLADFLNEVFSEAGCLEALNEASLMDYMDFSRVAEDLGKIGQVLKMLSPKLADLADKSVDGQTEVPGEEPNLGSEDPMASDSEAMPPKGMDANAAAQEVKDEVAQEVPPEEGADMPDEGMPDEGMPVEGEEEEEEDTMPPEGDIESEGSAPKEDNEIMDALSQLEDLLSGILKGDDDDDEEEEDEDEEESELDSEQYKS